jgi:hypothetical protein
MTTELVKANGATIARATEAAPVDAATMETVVGGNLATLSPAQRVAYYGQVCQSVGLNPFTKPFDFLLLNGKVVLYATKSATDQLRSLRGVSITIVSREVESGVLTVTARARMADGREDEDVGAVVIEKLSGDNLANAKMKAVTKAKRRVTLSICGLSMLDESEIETVKGARRVSVDASTGEIIDGAIVPDVDAATVVIQAAQAQAKSEDATFANELIADIGELGSPGDLELWVRMHGYQVRNMSAAAKGRVWTAAQKAAKSLGIAPGALKEMFANSNGPDEEDK